jgi:hypothetical protein
VRRAGACALVAVLLAAGCGQGPAPAAPPPPSAAPEDPRVAQARALLQRAETVPLPTPEPPPSPLPRGWTPAPAPEFKPEEVEAIRLLEAAAAASAGRPEAHEMLARILEPRAIRAHEREAAARASRKKAPPAPPAQGVDASPARVAREWRAAIEASPVAGDQIDALMRFATAVGDKDAIEWAHQETIRRGKENASAEPLAAYGDFLLASRKDPIAAAEQYRNALLWSPEDAAVKAKLADVYLALARAHLERQEFAAAESRVEEAAKYAAPGSEQARAVAGYRERLSAIRR